MIFFFNKKCCYCGKYLLSTENALRSLYTLWAIPENIWSASKTAGAFLFLLRVEIFFRKQVLPSLHWHLLQQRANSPVPTPPLHLRDVACRDTLAQPGTQTWSRNPGFDQSLDPSLVPSPVGHRAPTTSTHLGWLKGNRGLSWQGGICLRNMEENTVSQYYQELPGAMREPRGAWRAHQAPGLALAQGRLRRCPFLPHRVSRPILQHCSLSQVGIKVWKVEYWGIAMFNY